MTADLIAEAAGLFAVTNLDDIVILSLFSPRAPVSAARPER
jgi:cadmium resistance protein CadD (predicted permease)